jgi:16S rRNA (uracil1498-N3)-methyltransferase
VTKSCIFEITNQETRPRRPLHLHIAIAPTKMNDRMEWFLEKATEVGIEEITPVICDRSERRLVNAERFEKVVIAACKQSMQPWFPVLHPSTPLTDFLKLQEPGFIAHCASSFPRIPLFESLPESGSVCILIGPEGDFTPAEINQATSLGWKSVSLGQGRLRTETAGLVACVMASLRTR